MAKKIIPKDEEEDKEVEEDKEPEVVNIIPNSFELPYENPFYILEYPNEEKLYFVFNTLEGAVEYLDKLDDFDTKSTKLMGFNRDKEQFNVVQISWADIYQISKRIKKREK